MVLVGSRVIEYISLTFIHLPVSYHIRMNCHRTGHIGLYFGL